MKINNLLELETNLVIEGQNKISLNQVYIPASQFTLYNKFFDPISNKNIIGEWIKEPDRTLPAEKQEKRIFCLKGMLSFSFIGTNLSLRVELNPLWGKGHIFIDNLRPSQIAGAISYYDTISCNAYDYNSGGSEFKDVLIIEGLENTEHIVTIYCNNLDINGGEWFVINGAKVFVETNNTTTTKAFIVPQNIYPQALQIKPKNKSENIMYNIRINTNTSFLGNPSETITINELPATTDGDFITIPYNITGNESPTTITTSLTAKSYIKDPEGDILIGGVQTTLPVSSTSLQYTGAWTFDNDLGEDRVFTNSLVAYCLLTVPTSSFTIRVEKEWGWGTMAIMKGHISIAGCNTTINSSTIYVPDAYNKGVRVGQYVRGSGIDKYLYVESIDGNNIVLSGTASSTETNVTLIFRTLHTTISCGLTSGERRYEDVVVSGLNESGELIEIIPTTANYIVFSRISYTTAEKYKEYTQIQNINVNLTHLVTDMVNIYTNDYNKVLFDRLPPTTNYSQGISNLNIHGYEISARFPTFCCVYKPGYVEKMKEYDIVITDPMAVTYNEVKELQSLGIKVLIYVSFGEEDGERSDEWDLQNNDIAPRKGDGLGVGGYASYYMKGGYNFGEVSECNHDLKRKGEFRCAVNSNHYYNDGTQTRCSRACWNDWRTGYKTWIDNGECNAGHTKETYWQRDATKACSNENCPDYAPVNDRCPLYTPATEAWGQDFSMATPDYPDENGIWKSFYINAVQRGQGSWYERIKQHYLPLVFDKPKEVTTTFIAEAHTTAKGQPVVGFKIPDAPIDISLGLEIKNGSFIYTPFIDYNFDEKTGVFIMTPSDEAPPCPAGTPLTVHYWTRRLDADGVFMDTVDTVDVYNSPVYLQGMIDLINDMKKLYPDRLFCSNRGFSILPSIIKSCEYVMFETFLSSYNWETGEYFKITNPEEIEYNNSISELLAELRRTHTFDVLGLNYSSPNDTELKNYIREECFKRGYLCEISTILLDDVYQEYYKINPPKKTITTNKFKGVIYVL